MYPYILTDITYPRIMDDNRLIKHFKERPKHKGSMFMLFIKMRSDVVFSLSTSWSSQSGIYKSDLSEWKQIVLIIVLDSLKLSSEPRNNAFSVLEEHSSNNNLKHFQDKYVLVTIDVTLTCHRFYAQGLIKVLNIYYIKTNIF